MGLKICMGVITHRYYKHIKFRQNPRSDSKFLFDLTWNDPIPNYSLNKKLIDKLPAILDSFKLRSTVSGKLNNRWGQWECKGLVKTERQRVGPDKVMDHSELKTSHHESKLTAQFII